MKLEIVVISVSDVDRAKQFYSDLGWRLDIDYASGDDYRVIQFTPPGSGCSIIFGKNVTTAAPGSAKDVHLIVSDVQAVRHELLSRGIAISELFHDAGGVFHHAGSKDLLSGPNPQRKSYASYASFSDPDGNGWVFQEITARLTGHIAPGDTSFTPELTNAVGRASAPNPASKRVEDLGHEPSANVFATAQQSQEKPMFNEIDHDRRRLVGAAAMTIRRQPVRVQRHGRSPAVQGQASKSGRDQAGHEHIIRAAEADRCRRAEYRIRRSGSRGWPGRHSPARMAL